MFRSASMCRRRARAASSCDQQHGPAVLPLRRPVHRHDDVGRGPQEGRHRMGLPSPLLRRMPG
jgi:hypothetical protein